MVSISYEYEPKCDENGRKIKHSWDLDEVGFVRDASGHIEGKCPAGIDHMLAQRLLNQGIPDQPPEGWGKTHPKCFFNFHQGVVYKAVETNPGRSYHAYPCRGPRVQDMSERMKRKILDKARKDDCLAAIEQWFKEHP